MEISKALDANFIEWEFCAEGRTPWMDSTKIIYERIGLDFVNSGRELFFETFGKLPNILIIGSQCDFVTARNVMDISSKLSLGFATDFFDIEPTVVLVYIPDDKVPEDIDDDENNLQTIAQAS